MNILSGLTDSAQTTPAAPAAEPPIPALGDSAFPNVPEKVQLVLRGLTSGQIPGAYVPKGAKPIESGLKPDDLSALGIGIYRPKDPNILAVVFNPGQVSQKTLVALDAEGKLAENFPDLTRLLNEADASEDPESGSEPVPSESDPEHATRTQILPRPVAAGLIEQSQQQSATAPQPSKRIIPGGGTILNGLVARPA